MASLPSIGGPTPSPLSLPPQAPPTTPNAGTPGSPDLSALLGGAQGPIPNQLPQPTTPPPGVGGGLNALG